MEILKIIYMVYPQKVFINGLPSKFRSYLKNTSWLDIWTLLLC